MHVGILSSGSSWSSINIYTRTGTPFMLRVCAKWHTRHTRCGNSMQISTESYKKNHQKTHLRIWWNCTRYLHMGWKFVFLSFSTHKLSQDCYWYVRDDLVIWMMCRYHATDINLFYRSYVNPWNDKTRTQCHMLTELHSRQGSHTSMAMFLWWEMLHSWTG